MENCASCQYFMRQDEASGLCRRDPPSPVHVGDGISSFFPPMLNEGWCGEHKTKDQEQ
jgi:hypothetical protein